MPQISYSQQLKRSQQKCHMVIGYYKLRNHQHYKGRPISYKKRHNYNSNNEVKTTNVRQFLKESRHNESPNKSIKNSSTGYQHIRNKVKEVEPQNKL